MSTDRKEYFRNYQRSWIKNRRKMFFDGKSCEKCGSVEKLELHHIKPEEKEHHAIWSWAEKRRLAEIAKCQILCNSCHKKETRKWWDDRRQHGNKMYDKYGCRCEVCKLAKKIRNSKRKQQKKLP